MFGTFFKKEYLTLWNRELQDDITADWNPDVVARALKPYVTELKIDTVRLMPTSSITIESDNSASTDPYL